ncbi:hypothetical protein EOL72_00995 [Candidatus Falkowbacteria bacterium]|jgi:hypothetical protein|nr:hypothetical protein [Patescibacteria group bacterium]NCU42916.1 hypothetical protein [Candidatus Falkowbacteria bacterium]
MFEKIIDPLAAGHKAADKIFTRREQTALEKEADLVAAEDEKLKSEQAEKQRRDFEERQAELNELYHDDPMTDIDPSRRL